MLKISILTALLLALFINLSVAAVLPPHFLNDDDLDLFCLRLSYPAIKDARQDRFGTKMLRLANGMNVPYKTRMQHDTGLNVDVQTSMAEPYPLEPDRPETGEAPGRKRPYDLFFAMYGHEAPTVRRGLKTVRFNGSNLALASQAADAFSRAARQLAPLTHENDLKKYLKADGAFYWRKIAGEPWLSAHSFGIAVDLGASSAPYWRWQKRMPHPLQKSYSGKIVKIMEDHGFIWGGKWHEYDLMHFEYRPELICKAKMRAYMGKAANFPLKGQRGLSIKAQKSGEIKNPQN